MHERIRSQSRVVSNPDVLFQKSNSAPTSDFLARLAGSLQRCWTVSNRSCLQTNNHSLSFIYWHKKLD